MIYSGIKSLNVEMASQGNIDQEASYSFGAAPIAVDYIRFELMGPVST